MLAVFFVLSILLQHDFLQHPVPLRRGIGTVHHKVSTSSPEAQAFYDQGLAYLHSYMWIEAARSFNHALRLDPRLALAHVGLTYAYIELNNAEAARSALERARALSSHLADHDRAHILTRTAQMAAEASPKDNRKLIEYRGALDDALNQFPSDVEFWLQRGIAESPDPADRGQGSTETSIPFYQRALSLQPDHIAAHHYLTHAFENSNRIQDALKHGATYARLAPAVPHARHMYAHNLRRTGRIEQAIFEFEAANRLETEYFKRENIPAEHEWHYHHNLDLLATSYQYLGQMAKAEQLMKEAFAIPTSLVVQEFNKREWPIFLIGRGRFEEALSAANTMIGHSSPLIRATGQLLAGHAFLAIRGFEAAANAANAALRELRSAADGQALVATSLEHLQGEFFLRTGQREKGRAMLESVMQKVRRQPGPDQWVQALYTLEAIARAARESEDWEFSMQAARQMIEHDPSYAGSHYALALTARRAGDKKTAQAEFALAEKFWSKADPDLTELREIRSAK